MIHCCPFHPRLNTLIRYQGNGYIRWSCRKRDYDLIVDPCEKKTPYHEYNDRVNGVRLSYDEEETTCRIVLKPGTKEVRMLTDQKPCPSLEWFIDYCREKRYMTLVLFA